MNIIYDAILNSLADPVFVKDDHFKFVYTNNALCEMLGMKREDIIGKTLGESLPKDQMEHFLAIDKEVLASGVSNVSEELLTGKGGKILNITTKKTRYTDEEGHMFVVGIIRDETERKQNEEKIKENEFKYRSVVENTDTGFVVIDEQGKVISANEPYKRLAGFKDTDDIVGRFVMEWTAPEEKENNANAVALCAKQGFIKDFETVYQHTDGTKINVMINASVYKSPGKENQLLSYCRDITKRKQSESALQDKIAELERMNEIMIDREIKMVELKAEIERLKNSTQ